MAGRAVKTTQATTLATLITDRSSHQIITAIDVPVTMVRDDGGNPCRTPEMRQPLPQRIHTNDMQASSERKLTRNTIAQPRRIHGRLLEGTRRAALGRPSLLSPQPRQPVAPP